MAQVKLSSVDDYIKPVETWFLKFPALPKNVKDFIIIILPWVSLVFGVLGLLGSLAAIGLGTFLSPLIAIFGGVSAVGGFTISVIVGLVSSILLLLSVKGLFAKDVSGWRMLFLSEALGLIVSVLNISLVGILFTILWFYILFQIKSNYK